MSRTPMHITAIRGENGVFRNTLQHTATHCNTQHTDPHSDLTHLRRQCMLRRFVASTRLSVNYNTLQHTAIHCNTLQHIPISHISDAKACCGGSWRVQGCLYTATYCNTLKYTATHCNTYASHTSQTPRHVAAIRGEYKAVCTL